MIDSAVWPQQAWAENWRLCPFGEGDLGPHLTQYRLGKAYLRTKWHVDLSSRLVTIHIGCRLYESGEVGVAFSVGELGPHLTECGRGQGLPARQVLS